MIIENFLSYPTTDLTQEAINHFLNEQTILCQLGEGNGNTIDLNRVCAKLSNRRVDGNTLKADLQVVSTPLGFQMRTMLEATTHVEPNVRLLTNGNIVTKIVAVDVVIAE